MGFLDALQSVWRTINPGPSVDTLRSHLPISPPQQRLSTQAPLNRSYSPISSTPSSPISSSVYNSPSVQAGLNFGAPSEKELRQLALEQVAGQFAGQFEALRKARGSAKSQAATGDAKLKAMYKALVRDIAKNEKSLAGIYDKGSKEVASTYKKGKKDIGANYKGTREGLSKVLQDLGIEAAAPDVLKIGARDEAFAKDLNQKLGTSAGAALAKQKTGSLAFNKEQQTISRQGGVNRRADLVQQLNSVLSDLNTQRVGLIGQRDSAVAKQFYGLQEDAVNRQQNLYKIMEQQRRASTPKAPTLSQQWSMMGPAEKGYYKATELLGPNYGRTGLQLVIDTATRGDFRDPYGLAKAVVEANRSTGTNLPEDQLQALAFFMWEAGR